MAQLKDLIVQGNSRFIGNIYGDYIHLDKQLHIDIDQSTSATTNAVPLIVGQTNNINLAIGRIGIQCRNNGAANTLYLNYHSGSIQFGSSTSLTAPTRIFGDVTPGADNTYSLGTTDVLRWKNGFFTTALRVGPKDTSTQSTTSQNSYVGPEGFWQNQTTAGTSQGYTLRGKGKDYAKLYVSTLGVANTPGIAILQLGNATASTAADNSNGTLQLYSNTTKYTCIKSSLEITGNHLNYLPVYSATGTSTYYGRLVGIYKGTTSGSTGFSDVGSGTNPVYVTANGVVTKSAADVGNSYTPTYLNSGIITATSPAVIYASGSNTSASGQPARQTAVLQALMPTHNNSRPEAVQLSTGSGSVAFGYILAGDSYNTVAKAYGGYFIAQYNIPRYLGINDGTWSNRNIVTSATADTAVGSATKPVYVASTGIATAIDYTIEKSVPSNAVFTDTNTKVTSVDNHYAPSANANSALTASASGATAAWSIDVVKGITLSRDAKGHVTAVSVTSGKIPANPNTDTKVTAVGNHYAPSADSSSALTANASGASAAWSIDVVKGLTISRDAKGHVTAVSVTSGKIPANPNTDAMFHYYNSSAVSTAHWITTNITASGTGTVWVRGRIFGSKGTNSPAIVVFAAAFVKINDPMDGTTSVTLNYWDPLGLFSSFNAAFDSNKKVYFQFKYSTRYSRIEAIINHDTVVANEIASISTTAPTVQATYSGTKVTT